MLKSTDSLLYGNKNQLLVTYNWTIHKQNLAHLLVFTGDTSIKSGFYAPLGSISKF